MRTFDRRARFDEKSKQYRARTLTPATEPRSYTWRVPTQGGACPLNQGEEGACVGHAWVHEAAARPVECAVTSALAFQVYYEAQKNDYWQGEDYSGTSVLAGAKTMQKLGYIESYYWAFSLMETLTVASRHGPAVLGINWYEGMIEPDAEGFIRPTGRLLGGHAILLIGVSVRYRTVTLYNSWGPAWGKGGTVKMTWDDLALLLSQDGECCIPVKRKQVALAA